MKHNYSMLHFPKKVAKMLIKQDVLIPNKALLQQRECARESLATSDVLSADDWRFVPSLFSVEWDSFSIASIKQFHVRLGQGAFICDPVTFFRNYPDHDMHWSYKESKTLRKSASIESVLVRSFWNRGILLIIPDNVRLIEKIELGGYLATLGITLEDVTIIVGKNSSAHISCKRSSIGKGARYTMRSLTILLDDNASLNFFSDEQFSTGSLYVTESYYELKSNAKLNLFFVQAGNGFDKQRHEVVLSGAGAEADIRGVSGTGKSGHHDIVTYQTHRAANTKSSVQVRSLVGEKSRMAYQGLVHIDKNASGADASQDHKAILIDETARCWSVPSLEVLASDVACTHASATGILEKEQLLYLQSRGISLKKARNLLLRAFLYNVLSVSLCEKDNKDIIARVIKSASTSLMKKV